MLVLLVILLVNFVLNLRKFYLFILVFTHFHLQIFLGFIMSLPLGAGFQLRIRRISWRAIYRQLDSAILRPCG